MGKLEELNLVKSFIFNDDVQQTLSSINDNLMDFNILEITGMGNQEIKHSNILGWLFDDSEHNLEYYILDGFLKKVIEVNRENYQNNEVLDSLQSYIYLAEDKKNITIYREKDHIDLLIVDEANKVVIAIENKVDASERIDGEDGGQLKTYEKSIKNKYNKYDKYFIFLTINLEEPSREIWLKSSHSMIINIIENTLKTKEITTKTQIILESYVDLLKRNGIVPDERLKELCEKIWKDEKYREAFEVIINNRPSKKEMILKVIKSEKITLLEEKIMSGVLNIFLSLNEESPLVYRIIYNTKGKGLGYVVVIKPPLLDLAPPSQYEKLKYHNKSLTLISKDDSQFGYKYFTKFTGYFLEDEDITEDKIVSLLEQLREHDKQFINTDE